MPWSIGYSCDGHLAGRRCPVGVLTYTDDLDEMRQEARRDGFRPLSDVLSPDTHYVMAGELLCKRTDHDEEQPGYSSNWAPAPSAVEASQ